MVQFGSKWVAGFLFVFPKTIYFFYLILWVFI
jgi:hypothetical protein